MAIVNVLRFNDYAGAMIADEEYWVWGRRKSFFTDHIYHISNPALRAKLNMELVYGGVGHPPFHLELVNNLQKRLALIDQGVEHGPVPATTEDVGYLLLGEAQKTMQRRINDHLKFLYGVNIKDVNRGYFEVEGKRFDINQEKVKQELTNIVLQKGDNAMLKPLYKSRGVLIGIDPEIGFSGYHLNYDQSILAFISGGFEALGAGKYASGMVLGQVLNNINLDSRRIGLDPVEGVFTLFTSALVASESYNEVGGNFSLALITYDQKKAQPRYEIIQGQHSKLASEIVQAYRVEQIAKTTAIELLERLIFRKEAWEKLENELFTKARDRTLLEWRLAGFKADVQHEMTKKIQLQRTHKKKK